MRMQYSQEPYIAALLAALEARDAETAGHSRRVADMAERFCRYLDLPERERGTVVSAAALHDVGKIGMPDGVLYSARRFSALERREMRRHPEVGARILRSSGRPEEEAELVLCHHERWDGRGYPRGIGGEAIPPGARIIALCDSLDAMSFGRRYRAPEEADRCADELRRCAGAQFDPRLAEAFLDFLASPAAR